ncbi:MAG TPA: pyridoxamine 5'-phosphate oxidase family protein [Ilumatobacteraceae bacterium]|nr:pyridoxamine 5'-phosphate oxidase family protein [Ilumatobacteraceae bacterium]
MPRLTPAEVAAFLDEPGHLLRLATVDADGFPRLVPIWFIRRDDELLFTPRGPSMFLENIRRDPRVAVSIDEDPLPYRKVTVQGTARIVHELGADDEWRELYRTIAKRYVPPDGADAYVDSTIDQPRALVGVPLGGPSRTTTWRMPMADEDGTGIWHRRYYLDGTQMAARADAASAADAGGAPT